ncbi:acetyltransferase (GNAT) family protein [Roseivirga pacifica]|uniref:Acetyltransferase (GNAT) domain-containing protein n=1 Tax=Roseivirga pacifica TaxID=1267423 RepID=A0A1I0RHT2_9BACT|nr:GNAT family N-acetyltransferase [Roseivirga pacifica]RKQ49649.1 acetyltransferase (GNAT) family protein [Roseivirga pacifica]SEW40413.1 Acetyltransferase (GNAT) domain-containing protein [Roseivirga pacifica]
MEGLHVIEHLPTNYTFEYEPLFYGTPTFLEANNALPQKHFYLVDNHYHKVFASIAFSIEEGTAYSPAKAPFSGYEFAQRLNPEERIFFMIEVERRLKQAGVKALNIGQAPSFFNTQFEKEQRDLGFLEYQKAAARVYHSISVDSTPFEGKVHDMEKRKLKKSAQGGLNFQMLDSSDLEKVFAFIKLQRDLKGYEFSMSWEELRDAARLNPGMYLPAVMLHDKKIAAATIAIRESKSVLYNFAPAHAPAYNELSPVVALVQGLYEWSQAQAIKWLNLGTSYLDGAPNEPLVQFKERLGGVSFSAFSFQKSLNS